MKHKLNNMDKEELRKRMSKAIGSFENEMVYNISNDCSEIAVRYFNEQLKQHGVMQAEGSASAEGAAVGNRAAGQSGRVSGSIISRCKDCGTIMQWPVSTTICDRCAEAPPEGALPR